MKRKLTLLLTAVVSLLAFTGTASTPPDATAKIRVNHNTTSATSAYHKAVSQSSGTFTPLRYITSDVSKPGVMVKAKAMSEAASLVSAAPIAKADANTTYPDLHASVTTYSTTARNSRIAKLALAQDQVFTTKLSYVWANYGGVGYDHTYYYFSHQAVGSTGRYSNTLWSVNTDTYDSKSIARDDDLPIGLGASDVAYNPVDKKVYGCFVKDESEGTGYVFGTVDYVNLKRTKIADLPDQWNAFAIDSKGTGYAIDMSGQLLKVDLTNGSTTVVGSTGLKPYYVSSATIDVKSDRMFYAVLTEDAKSSLYEINTSTAAATFIVSYDDRTQICGMFVPSPLAEDHAPAAPTGLSANFPNGSYSGTVEFDVPATYYNGDAATGTVTYTVASTISDTVRGTASFGQHVTVPVTVNTRGYRGFTVRLYNDVGKSPEATSSSYYIGPGYPAAPTKVTLTAEGDSAKLTWAAAESADRFYFDADSIRYTVVRLPGGEQVYDGYDTKFAEKVENDGTFTKLAYKVKATTKAGMESAQWGQSNGVSFGVIVPPYEETFDTEGDVAGYTIIDANNDNRTWAYFSATASMRANYSSKNKGDDWLITPPVKLKADETYCFHFDAVNKQKYVERFEVKVGNAPTVEGMTQVIVDTVTLAGFESSTPTVYYKAPADGNYYFGIHYVSDANMFGIYADNIAIDAGTPGTAPDTVSAITFVNDPTGAVAVNISFKAPAKNIKGDAISKVDSIVVAKNGAKIKEFGSTAAGQECSFTDTDEKDGSQTYTFTAYADGVGGLPVSRSVFVGIGVPDTVRNLAISEDKNALGTVNITWDAPASDVNGAKLNADVYTYTVAAFDYDGNETVVADSIKGGKFTHKATDGEQKFVLYSVYANDRVGKSAHVYTDMLPVGNPDKMPFVESFANAQTSHAWAAEVIFGGSNYVWSLANDQSITDFTSQDHDNGYAMFFGFDTFVSAFNTGKINLSGLAKPTLTFYNYNIDTDDVNQLDVQISTDGKSWTTLKSYIENSLPHTGWNRISVPLDAYAGKEVRLRWIGHLNLYSHIFLDNIKIDEAVICDVAATDIEAPSKVEAGDEFDVAVTVENQATTAVSNVKVTLYCNDEAVADSTIATIASDDAKQVVFKQKFTNLDDADNTFYGKVTVDGDQNAANNNTDTVTVIVKLPTLPTPINLQGSASADGTVNLKWTAPDLDNIVPAAYTETFESADTKDVFPTTFGDWKFVDVDQKPIGGPNTFSLPGIDYESRQSFFVMDASNAVFSTDQLKQLYAAHSGSKYLSNMYLYNEGVVNDWAISPALAGIEQDISFYARCFTKAYPETFQVLYSTTDTEISSFKQVGEETAIQSTDWTKFFFTLPEGAKYFAIRCTSNSAYSLYIDDVTYIPASTGEKGVLEGYNVYRDGVKVNSELVTDVNYVDSQLPEGEEFTYAVTAVIKDRGESAASNKVVIKKYTGIDGTEVNRTVVSVDYYDTLGRKVVEPAAGAVVIERTVFDDGSSITVKKIVK